MIFLLDGKGVGTSGGRIRSLQTHALCREGAASSLSTIVGLPIPSPAFSYSHSNLLCLSLPSFSENPATNGPFSQAQSKYCRLGRAAQVQSPKCIETGSRLLVRVSNINLFISGDLRRTSSWTLNALKTVPCGLDHTSKHPPRPQLSLNSCCHHFWGRTFARD